MEKVLKKYTTIPQPLYVDRYADTQLKRIIEEMQRPGYVLVARQMGKTNLLFNAKRTLENDNRLFAYVDLSNLYNTERDCYRNIINSIIEPNLAVFESIEVDIEKIREKDLPPHNEYSRSLIKILNHFQGDLVIILDEIDALKSINYSDNIFAQIRSNYFSRTNYPVLERLTYVLSGVIEPTELIKDKNKSPFNIGDKIYLDDFTKEEHNSFIEKSRLQISEAFADEIFGWTNGNPRLTFDVCAEVENYLINKGEINSEILKNIIIKKYLTSFDIAPIDHIRELAKSNKDIRKAILSIHKQSTYDISDDIKRKLYLYGIINSKFNEETHIKNRIIELSLSEDWIKSIEREREYTYVLGLTSFSEKNFTLAIEVFQEVIQKSTKEKEVEGSNYFLGLSYIKIHDYKNAEKYFSYEYKNVEHKNDALAFLGVCQMALGDIKAIETLEKAIEVESNTHAYHNALLNLAVKIEDNDRALNLFERLYKSTFNSNNEEEVELAQLRTLSLYYQSEILERENERENAIEKLKQALEYSNISDSLFLLLNQHYLLDSKTDEFIIEIVNRIIGNDLRFEKNDSYPISFKEVHIYFYLELAFKAEDKTLFDRLLEYVHNKLIVNKNIPEIIYEVSIISRNNQKEILDYLIHFSDKIENSLLLNIFRDMLFISIENNSIFLKLFEKYLFLFKEIKTPTNADIYVFAFCIKLYSDRKEVNKGIQLCEILIPEIEKNENLKYESIIIYYWYSNLFFSKKDKIKASRFADIALKLIQESNGEKLSMIDETGLKSISNQLNQIKLSSQTIRPISVKKFGRNDKIKVRYANGNIREDKYKRLEADILAERCILIE